MLCTIPVGVFPVPTPTQELSPLFSRCTTSLALLSSPLLGNLLYILPTQGILNLVHRQACGRRERVYLSSDMVVKS